MTNIVYFFEHLYVLLLYIIKSNFRSIRSISYIRLCRIYEGAIVYGSMPYISILSIMFSLLTENGMFLFRITHILFLIINYYILYAHS